MSQIKVTFMVDSDNMSDEEYENQEEKTLIITKDMIKEMIMDEYPKLNPLNDTIENIELKIIK